MLALTVVAATTAPPPTNLGGLLMLFLYIRGIVKSKGKRVRAFLYSLAALALWLALGVSLDVFAHANLGALFGGFICLPLWVGTMFTREPKGLIGQQGKML